MEIKPVFVPISTPTSKEMKHNNTYCQVTFFLFNNEKRVLKVLITKRLPINHFPHKKILGK